MNPILDKEPVKRAEKSIKEFDPNLKIVCLEQTARTAQEAATALGCNVGAIVKSLLFSTGNSFVLCLVSGDKRCSLNKLKKILDEIAKLNQYKIYCEVLNSNDYNVPQNRKRVFIIGIRNDVDKRYKFH